MTRVHFRYRSSLFSLRRPVAGVVRYDSIPLPELSIPIELTIPLNATSPPSSESEPIGAFSL